MRTRDFPKVLVSAILAFLCFVACASCGPTQDPVPPQPTPSFYPWLNLGLTTTVAFADLGAAFAVEREEVVACFVASGVRDFAKAAQPVVRDVVDDPTRQLNCIPAFEVDVSKCLALMGGLEADDFGVVARKVVEAFDKYSPLVTDVIDVAVQNASSVTCENKVVASGVLTAFNKFVDATVVFLGEPMGPFVWSETCFDYSGCTISAEKE